MRGGSLDDGGVENELLILFQRFARYPGVEENDLMTLSVTETELASVFIMPDDASCFGVGGKETFSSGTTTAASSLLKSRPSSAASGRSSSISYWQLLDSSRS